jgi:DNA transformation protein
MAVSDEYLQYVLEQLAGLGHIVPRRMFGAVGLYHEERFFGLISRDTLYLKANQDNREDYETRRMPRFHPRPHKPQLSMTYYELPADVLEDAEACAIWARKSVVAAAPPVEKQAPPTRRKAAARKPRR